jgi:hypothetical protein
MELSDEQVQWLKERMYALIPEDGRTIGNINLRGLLSKEVKGKLGGDLSSDDYWSIRNGLIAEGKIIQGGGMGGSVRRVLAEGQPGQARIGAPVPARERDLYEPFNNTVSSEFTKDKRITNFVCQVTAHQGKRQTGGQWTRPDITLIAVRIFQFVPGRMLEVITFEVKPLNGFGVEGVFETAAHSVFANKCYLAVQVPEGEVVSSDFDRLQRECKRFGVGLLTFADPSDYGTFEEIVEPQHRNPDPAEVSAFIGSQLSAENKAKVDALTRS